MHYVMVNCSWIVLKKSFFTPQLMKILSNIISEKYLVLPFTWKPLMYLKLCFGYGVRFNFLLFFCSIFHCFSTDMHPYLCHISTIHGSMALVREYLKLESFPP